MVVPRQLKYRSITYIQNMYLIKQKQPPHIFPIADMYKRFIYVLHGGYLQSGTYAFMQK